MNTTTVKMKGKKMKGIKSMLYIEMPKDNRQCPSCKHKFAVSDKKRHTCPECGNTNTRTIA